MRIRIHRNRGSRSVRPEEVWAHGNAWLLQSDGRWHPCLGGPQRRSRSLLELQDERDFRWIMHDGQLV